jgi:hypothetical protein
MGLAWLLLANRVPHLDQFASERNLALAIAFVLLGFVPTWRFMKSPGRSFLSITPNRVYDPSLLQLFDCLHFACIRKGQTAGRSRKTRPPKFSSDAPLFHLRKESRVSFVVMLGQGGSPSPRPVRINSPLGANTL